MDLPARTRRRRRSIAGFTLMEMVTVLAVIAGSAALAMPGLASAGAKRTVLNAQSSALRLMRRGRSLAFTFGRAHLIRYRKNVGYELWRGKTNSCSQEAWYTEIIAGPAMGTSGTFQVDDLDLAGVVTFSAVNAAGTAYNDIDFCYQPNGTVKWRTGSGMNDSSALSSLNTVGGGFIFRFQRTGVTDVVNEIVLPIGGSAARVRQ